MLDVGSSTVKLGYAGEDCPKAVFPSAVGVLHASASSARERDVGRSTSAIGDSMDVEAKAATSTASTRYFVGTTALAYRRDFMELQNPLTDGIGTAPLASDDERLNWADLWGMPLTLVFHSF